MAIVKIKKYNKETDKQEVKFYEQVADRVKRFREQCPVKEGWGLVKEIIRDEKTVLAIAKMVDPEGRVVSDGHAEEVRGSNQVNQRAAVENAETSAVGRCLYFAGFGNGEVCSLEELVIALQRQNQMEKVANLGLDEMVKFLKEQEGVEEVSVQEDAEKKAKNEKEKQTPDLPQLPGVVFVVENGKILAKGKTYSNKNTLKDLGFRYAENGVWVKELEGGERNDKRNISSGAN